MDRPFFTVAQLIEELKKYNPDAPVFVWITNHDGPTELVTQVCEETDGGIVIVSDDN